MDIYVSTDVETDGPIPGPHSMLSIGSAAYRDDGSLLDTFSANLLPLVGASPDPKTMSWWDTQPEAWAAHRQSPLAADEVMPRCAAWLDGLASQHKGRLVFVAWPAGFDFSFVYWYLIRFAGRSPFGHSALDMRSYAMGKLGRRYGEVGKHRLPKSWIPEARHTHVALDDAIEQGQLFMNMMGVGQVTLEKGE